MPPGFGSWPRSAVLVCIALLLHPAVASANDPAALCERAIVAGARNASVPQEVLHAISLTETGRPSGGRLRPWPWAVNREGQGFWFQTREEALAFAKKSVAEGRHSFDVGCFQINYHWHGDGFASVEAMFDPDVAAAYAARFLQDLHAETGSWSQAAGAYHSRTPHYANIYRSRFDRIVASLGGQPLVVADAAPEDADAGEATGPRRSRMRMARGPLIIRVASVDAAPDERIARVHAERLEKALPVSVSALEPAAGDLAGEEIWVAAAGPRGATGPR
jgi:hypothetical protein